VSPLWRDEIGAYLSPHRLCLVRMQRGLRPRQIAAHELALQPQNDAWSTPVETFAQLLAEASWHGAPVRIVIADHWARYAVIPWDGSVSAGEERLAHGRQLLTGIYGETIADWDVRISEAPPQAPRVACAVPSELVSGLRAACATQGMNVLSLQPQLIAAYAAWRHCLPGTNAWFVSIEKGSLAAARLGAAGWDRVYGVRIGVDWMRELKRLQTFGRLASSSPGDGQVYVDAPHAWAEVAALAAEDGTAAASLGLQWLSEEGGPPTTLQCLNRARRLAA